LINLQKGKDLRALVVLAPVTDTTTQQEIYMSKGIPPQVQEVIHDFEHLFQAPDALPPRVFDHAIALLPDTIPINYKPYRYSPHQKDDIEKQVTNMIQSGLVVPCQSPFASLVLLVKKKRWDMEVLCGLSKTQCSNNKE
jgi:hypothetical protein